MLVGLLHRTMYEKLLKTFVGVLLVAIYAVAGALTFATTGVIFAGALHLALGVSAGTAIAVLLWFLVGGAVVSVFVGVVQIVIIQGMMDK